MIPPTQTPAAQFFSTLLGQAPLIVAYLLGLVLCSTRWTRYPRPAQFAFLGTTFLLIDALGQPLVIWWIGVSLPDARSGELRSILSFVGGIVRGTGYAFLLGAAFFGRAAHGAASRSPAPTPAPSEGRGVTTPLQR